MNPIAAVSVPYNLNTVCNINTDAWGLTKEKVASLEQELLRGDFSPLLHVLRSVRTDAVFPGEMIKWLLFHVEKNICILTDEDCQYFHEFFCKSRVFDSSGTGTEPDPLAFLLASPTRRAWKRFSLNDPIIRPDNDPKKVLSFINRLENPIYSTFKEAMEQIEVFRYWILGNVEDYFFVNYDLISRCIKINGDVNRSWVEMEQDLAKLYDDNLLTKIRNVFCRCYIRLHSHGQYDSYCFRPGVYYLPLELLRILSLRGPFFSYLAENTNGVDLGIINQTKVALLQNLDEHHRPTLQRIDWISSYDIIYPDQFMKAVAFFPKLKNIYIMHSGNFHLDHLADLLTQNIHLVFACKIDLIVTDVNMLAKVSFETLEHVKIISYNSSSSISYPGWQTHTTGPGYHYLNKQAKCFWFSRS